MHIVHAVIATGLLLGGSAAWGQEARESSPEDQVATPPAASPETAPAETPAPERAPVRPAPEPAAGPAEEDDFIPTEEISADKPVSFPVDI